METTTPTAHKRQIIIGLVILRGGCMALLFRTLATRRMQVQIRGYVNRRCRSFATALAEWHRPILIGYLRDRVHDRPAVAMRAAKGGMVPEDRWVHYYVHGRGRGHATRTLAVLSELRSAGFSVRVFAGREAFPVLSRQHALCEAIESVPQGISLAVVALLRRRVRDARAWIELEKPVAVVSDSDGPGIWAAYRSGVGSIAVGHGLVFGFAQRPPGLPRVPWLREKIKARIAAAFSNRQVAANFVPLQPLKSSAVVVAPELRWELREAMRAWLDRNPTESASGAKDDTNRQQIDVGTSAGRSAEQPDASTRAPLEPDEQAKIVCEDAGMGSAKVVCYFQDHNGAPVLRELVKLGLAPLLFSDKPSGVDGVRTLPLGADGFARILCTARCVVSPAGSQLISECVQLKIPIFALYDQRDDEKRLNVAMLRSFGLGDGVSYQEFSSTRLRGFLRQYLEHAPASASKPGGLAKVEHCTSPLESAYRGGSSPTVGTAVCESVKRLATWV